MNKPSSACFCALLLFGSLTACVTDQQGEVSQDFEPVDTGTESLVVPVCSGITVLPAAEVTRSPKAGSELEVVYMYSPASGTSYTADFHFPSGKVGKTIHAINRRTWNPLHSCESRSMEINVWIRSATTGCWGFLGTSSVKAVLEGHDCFLSDETGKGPINRLPDDTSTAKVKFTSTDDGEWMEADLLGYWNP